MESGFISGKSTLSDVTKGIGTEIAPAIFALTLPCVTLLHSVPLISPWRQIKFFEFKFEFDSEFDFQKNLLFQSFQCLLPLELNAIAAVAVAMVLWWRQFHALI